MSKSWYVVNSYSGYENKAKEQLLERIERENPVSYTHLTLPTIDRV